MSKSRWVSLACVLLLITFGLTVRMVYQANTVVDAPLRADAGQYHRIAWNVINHGVFSMAYPAETSPEPDSYRGPGYPLLIALSMRLGGEEHEYLYLLVIQALIGALSAGLTFLLARCWLSTGYALAAGLLVAIWPHSVAISGLILTETLYGFCLLLAVYLLSRAWQSRSMLWYGLSGLVFAWAALVNPGILFFPLALALLLAVQDRKCAIVFLLCALLLPGVWSVRGAMLDTGSSSSGRLMENVLACMDRDFAYKDTPDANAARERMREGVDRFEHDSGAELQRIVDRLATEPWAYARWYLLEKPIKYWRWALVEGGDDLHVYPVSVSAYHNLTFFQVTAALCRGLNQILMLGAFSAVAWLLVLFASRHGHQVAAPLLYVSLLFAYATALHSVLMPDPRYAIPFRPFQIMLALSLVAMVHTYWRSHAARQREGLTLQAQVSATSAPD